MSRLLSWVVDFVVGDDPRVAVGIALALAVTGAAVRAGFDPWWLVTAAVPLVVGGSLRRATRKQPP